MNVLLTKCWQLKKELLFIPFNSKVSYEIASEDDEDNKTTFKDTLIQCLDHCNIVHGKNPSGIYMSKKVKLEGYEPKQGWVKHSQIKADRNMRADTAKKLMSIHLLGIGHGNAAYRVSAEGAHKMIMEGLGHFDWLERLIVTEAKIKVLFQKKPAPMKKFVEELREKELQMKEKVQREQDTRENEDSYNESYKIEVNYMQDMVNEEEDREDEEDYLEFEDAIDGDS